MNTLHIAITTHNLIRILSLGFLGFALSMAITPLYTNIAYRQQWWKRQRTEAWAGGTATVYQKLHAAKHKRNIPTMAGLIFIIAISTVTLIGNLNRGQTWLPLAGLIAAGIIGLADDIMNIRGSNGIAGMPAKLKFLLYSAISVAGGWWFYSKLGIHSSALGRAVAHWRIGNCIILAGGNCHGYLSQFQRRPGRLGWRPVELIVCSLCHHCRDREQACLGRFLSNGSRCLTQLHLV